MCPSSHAIRMSIYRGRHVCKERERESARARATTSYVPLPHIYAVHAYTHTHMHTCVYACTRMHTRARVHTLDTCLGMSGVGADIHCSLYFLFFYQHSGAVAYGTPVGCKIVVGTQVFIDVFCACFLTLALCYASTLSCPFSLALSLAVSLP